MSNTTRTQTVQPTDVKCPACGAEPTAHCVSETGKRARRTHSARLREAEQAELEVADDTTATREPRLQPGDEIAPAIVVVEESHNLTDPDGSKRAARKADREVHQSIMDGIVANSPNRVG